MLCFLINTKSELFIIIIRANIYKCLMSTLIYIYFNIIFPLTHQVVETVAFHVA